MNLMYIQFSSGVHFEEKSADYFLLKSPKFNKVFRNAAIMPYNILP